MKIFLIGFMGSGKSYWARELSQKTGLPHFDLDEQIELIEGRQITTIFSEAGEEYFRRKEQEVLMHLCDTHQAFVMATGGGTPCFFNNIDFMNRVGTTIWINPSLETLLERLKVEQAQRPLLTGLDEEQLKAYIIRKLGDRKIFYQQAEEIVYEDEQTLDNLVSRIFQSENKN